jgi:ABC-type phosphate/phosphonate transport system substrate-binding protein
VKDTGMYIKKIKDEKTDRSVFNDVASTAAVIYRQMT